MVEEDHLLLFLDTYDDVILNTGASICMQVDIQKAYVLAPIVSIDYGFRTVNDDEVILDLETPQNVRTKSKYSSGKQTVQVKHVCATKNMKTTMTTWDLL